MTIRCVLFDLFGTLVQYDAGRVSQDFSQTFKLFDGLANQLSYDTFIGAVDGVFSELDRWSAQHQQEYSMRDVAVQLFDRLNVTAPTDELMDQFAESYTLEWSKPVVPVHGVQALLSRCARQFVTGLITNTHYEPMVQRLMTEHRFEGFGAVTCSVTHGRPKPHPDVFLDTMEKLDMAPHECVYVGDNYSADFLGATQVGARCYLIGNHARVPREYQIPTVMDLPLHLLK